MGIKDLRALVGKCPKAQRLVPLILFKGKRIAIDAGNIMVKTIASVWSKEVERTKYPNKQPDMKRFMYQWLNRLQRDLELFLEAGITPVYVFDGKAPIEKADCKAERRQKRKKNTDEYDALMKQILTMDEGQRYPYIQTLKRKAKSMFPYSDDMVNTMKEFYSVMGVPVIQCNEEAERLCAQLCLSGYCSASYTEDRDTLAHGCPIIMIKIGGTVNYNGRSVGAVEIIDLYEILVGLNLTYRQFVDVCIMCGCDYNSRIKQIGPGRAYPMIQKYGSIANIPSVDINRFLNRHVKRNPQDANMLLNPKGSLNVNSCYKRFSPIAVEQLLSKYDLENQTLSKLAINKKLGVEAANFLASYQLDNILKIFINLYAFHPSVGKLDALPHHPPDIIRSGWARFIVGTSYLELWGV